MVPYLGDYNTTETVIMPFNTFTSDDPTASTTITNLVAGDVEIHKDGSTAQRLSDSGVTVSTDFDSVTGNHLISIDLSDNTDAGFYVAGSRYQVRVEGITVDGGTINAWVGSFSIGCILRPSVNGRALGVGADGDLLEVNTLTGHTAQTGDSFAAIGSLNDVSAADVNAACDTALSDYGANTTTPPTVTEITNHIDANSTQLAAILADTGTDIPATLTTIAEYLNTEIADILEDTSTTIPGLLSALDTIVTAIQTVTDKLDTSLELDGADYRFTANALEEGPSSTGGDATAANQTAILTHLTEIKGATFVEGTDSLEAIRDRGDVSWITGAGGSSPTVEEIRTEIDSNSTQLADLTTRLTAARAGYLDKLNVTGTLAHSDAASTYHTDVSSLATSAALATVDTNVSSILTDTQDIQTQVGVAGAGLTALPDVTLANGNHGGASASLTLASYSDFTGAAAANPNVLQDGTVTVNDQSSFVLSSGSFDDDAYTNMVIVFKDSATATQKSVRTVTDYVGSTKTVTVDSPPDFTIADTDNFSILAVAPGSTPPTAGQVADAVWDEAIADHTTVGSFGAKNQKEVPSESVADYKTDITALATASALATVDTVVDAIKAKTDNLPTDPADQSVTEAYIDALEAHGDLNWSGSGDATAANQTTIINHLTDVKGSGFVEGTDSLEAIRNQGDSAWVTGAGGAAPTVEEIRAEIDSTSTQLATLVSRLSAARAGYLDKLNVTGTLAHSDAADSYKADISSLVTDATLTSALGNLNDITVAEIISGISEGSYDLQEMLRIMFSVLIGKSTGGGTNTIKFKDPSNTKDRVTATVDENNNRTSVVLNGS